MRKHTRYQQKVIQEYYKNRDKLAEQRLGELVSDLYLAQGKRLDQLWRNVAAALAKIRLPQSRVEHILGRRDPALVAAVVKELQSS